MSIVNLEFRNCLSFHHLRLYLKNVSKDQIVNMTKLTSHSRSISCLVFVM